MKRKISGILVLAMVVVMVFGSVATYAENDVFKFYIKGNEYTIPDGYGTPYFQNERTMIPLRAIVEALSIEVNYDDRTQTITIPCNGGSVTLKLGSNIIKTPNGDVTMDTQAVTINDRTYVPLRFISECLGYTVDYKQVHDNSGAYGGVTHVINITDGSTPAPTTNPTPAIQGVASISDFNNSDSIKEFIASLPSANILSSNNATIEYQDNTSYVWMNRQPEGFFISVKPSLKESGKAVVKGFLEKTVENPDALYNIFMDALAYSISDASAEEFGQWRVSNLDVWRQEGNVQYMLKLDKKGFTIYYK